MSERAPLGVTYYLEPDDAALFAALWPARNGCRFVDDAHQKLIDAGLLEREPYNPGPNGECMDDVRLTKKGEHEIVRLKNAADEGFRERRAQRGAREVPGSSAMERQSRGPVPRSGGNPSGRSSRPEPQANTNQAHAGPAHTEGA